LRLNKHYQSLGIKCSMRERDGVSHKAAMGKISVINVSATTCVSSPYSKLYATED